MTLQLPVQGTLDNVDVVIVSAEEYARLRASGAAEAHSPGPLSTEPPTSRPPIPSELSTEEIIVRLDGGRGRVPKLLYDREVARFLIDRLGSKPDTFVLADCIERFGRERAPSTSALCRFSICVREVRQQARGLPPPEPKHRKRAR